jgi:hypothetical protein
VGAPWRRSLLGVGALAVLGATHLASVWYGMRLHETKAADSFATFFENAIQTRLAVIPNLANAWLRASPERIAIEVAPGDHAKLAARRAEAQRIGILISQPGDFVPAHIRHGERVVEAKIRLKGDWVDHLHGDKWSFRVKVEGDGALLGMRHFSLHHPKTRNFVHEWIYHRALARENVIALRYDFVEVGYGGRSLGIYALEEHFDAGMLEHNARREGPILKLDETLHWDDLAVQRRKGGASPTGLQAEEIANAAAFGAGDWLEGGKRRPQLLAALSLLESFRAGELPLAQTFDAEKLAAYFAISDLMGATHGVQWINLRFHYDPITARLEPVGFDGNAGARLEQLVGSAREAGGANRFKERCFSDPGFFALYVKALERVSAPAYLDALLAELSEDLEERLHVLYREFPWWHWSPRVLRENQETIRAALHPAKGLHAHLASASPQTLELELGAIQGLPVEVLGVKAGDGTLFRPGESVLLAPAAPGRAVAWRTARFETPSREAGFDGLGVQYRIVGSSEIRSDEVFPWPRRVPGLAEASLPHAQANAASFGFLAVEEATRTIRVRPGRWTLDGRLVLPEGYTLVMRGGSELELRGEGRILSRSALDLRGSEEEPIVIRSDGAAGHGLAVLGAKRTSKLRWVRFLGLGTPAEGGFAPSAAVTFHESPVEIADCEFAGSRGDALNLVRSPFSIDRSLFRDASSDAFDADFSDGRIARTAFLGAGSDAVDVSGSRVELEEVTVERAGARGIGAGEGSVVAAARLRVSGARTGVASQDRAEVRVRGLELADTGIGLVAYQKTPHHGPASLEVEQARLDGVRTPWAVETGSRLVVDGRQIPATGSGLGETLYGAAAP